MLDISTATYTKGVIMPEAKPSYFITTPLLLRQRKATPRNCVLRTLLYDIRARFRRVAGYRRLLPYRYIEHGEKACLLQLITTITGMV